MALHLPSLVIGSFRIASKDSTSLRDLNSSVSKRRKSRYKLVMGRMLEYYFLARQEISALEKESVVI